MIPCPENIKEIPVFFILSRPRTGSTLLRMFLEAHPDVAIPTECPALIDLYGKYKKVRIWDEKKISKLYKDLLRQWKFNRWDTDHELLKDNLLRLKGEHGFPDFYKTINLSYNSPYLKNKIQIIGDKNPGYSIYVKKILKIYPEAKFIHLIRDFRTQIASVRKFDFEAPSVSLLAYRWKYIFRKLISAEKKYPEKFIRVKYEDMVSDPENIMKKICDFLNIPFYSSILNYYQNEKKYLDKYNDQLFKHYFPDLFSPIKSVDIHSNSDILKGRDVYKAGYITGNYSVLAGYEKTDSKPGFFTRAVLIFPQIYGYSWYQLKYFYDSMPLAIKKVIGFPTFFGLLYNKIFGKEK